MKRKLVLGAALVALLVASAATYSWAAASADPQTLNACVNTEGAIRLVALADSCKSNEHAVSWNTVGPAGPAGAPGAAGAAGPAGPAGPAGASAVAPPDPDAAAGTVQITSAHGPIGPIDLTGISHEIVSPRDAGSGLPTGKRMHKPITITKQLDKSSPLLLSALITNLNLSQVLIGLNKGGTQVATIKLTNASIASYDQHGTSETWSFTYQKIEWEWLDGGITAMEDLGTPSA